MLVRLLKQRFNITTDRSHVPGKTASNRTLDLAKRLASKPKSGVLSHECSAVAHIHRYYDDYYLLNNRMMRLSTIVKTMLNKSEVTIGNKHDPLPV